jgi:4-amino-4-deoxy-L-arabinose transferase-like glycosyltransferase
MELSKAALSRNLDLALPASIIAGFVVLAAQRLGTVPVPDKGDEAFMLQVPYELLYRGKFALPMYRFLGGNIENAWHSLRPVYFLTLSGFYKVFGLGLTQGRAFNLLTAALTLLFVYLIGRRMVNWQAGLIAVLMLVSDLLFFERARMLRNDFPAAMFALLAFYLFEKAEQNKRAWVYFLSGLSAGAGVMCHTNVVYVLAALGLLILLADGLSVFRARRLYVFSSGVFVATAYEVIYGVIDYKNLRLQYRGDNAHFSILSWSGFWQNLLEEPQRYADWYNGGVMFGAVPRTLSHLFQYLTIVALVYLIARSVRAFKRGTAMAEPRVRIVIVTLVAIVFFTLFTRKTGYYMIHLECWFALCVGIMLFDLLWIVGQLRLRRWPKARLMHTSVVACLMLVVPAFGYQLARQTRIYFREVRNPELASFEEFKQALRSVVPEGLCPVVVTAPVIAIVFPEDDRCFATIEPRMEAAVDIDGKDYALLMRHRNEEHWANELTTRRHLLGEVRNTPYGNFFVYYTGVDRRYLALEPRQFNLFGRWRGHVSEEQIALSREVWKADSRVLNSLAGKPDSDGYVIQNQSFVDLCSPELAPNTAYQLQFAASSPSEWEAVIIDAQTGVWLMQTDIGNSKQPQQTADLFRTLGANRVRIAVRPSHKSNEPISVYEIKIREVSRL